jgi:hypothetical protein
MKDIILYKTQTYAINLNNSGTMNQSSLDFAKRTMLFDVIREHINLVKTTQHYPQGDISDVDMEIDCVIMSKKRYEKLLKAFNILNNLDESKQDNSISKYLNLPKLEA